MLDPAQSKHSVSPLEDTDKENQLTNYINNLPIAIYTCDRQGFITSYNKAAANLWGREPKPGSDLWCGSWKIFQPDGQELPLETCPMAIALKEGVPIEGEEIIIKRPDGTIRNILPYPVPTFDQEGVLTGAINTLIDITEQKTGEAKQAMLAAIIQTSDDAIISKTLDGIITSWNHAAENMFGYSEQEALGKHITILIPPERLSEEDFIIGKVRKGEKVDHFETIRVTKSGKRIPISLTVSAIKDSKGRIIGASKIARNISRQKEAEKALKIHAENLEILNATGKIISADLNIEGIMQKVTDATTLLTAAAFGAFFYNTLNEHGESYSLYTLSGAPKESFEKFGMPRNSAVFHTTFKGEGVVRVDDITKDERYGKNPPHYGMPEGHLPVISYLAVPVISKSGKVIGGLFYGHPEAARFTQEHEKLVTAVASQAAIALDNAELYEEVKSLNARKDEFIGLASHELKTPVTSISGYLQILERSLPENAESKIFAGKAIQQINKLSALVSDLLDVSRIHTGQMLPLARSSFDMVQLIKEVIEPGKYLHTTHQIVFQPDVAQLTVYADKQRIEQVIINLISNAIKYSPRANRVIIRISAENDKARVSVQDFGIGIAPDQQERIFSRFYRVEEDQLSHISGLGIGLYISGEIIKQHHGYLGVNSKPGEGSTFFFEIPVSQ